MTGKILWKVIVSVLVFIWAGLNLVPNFKVDQTLQDLPFDEFLVSIQQKQNATDDENQRFKKLLQQAETKVQSDPKENPSLYLALLNLGAKGFTHYKGGEVTTGEDKDVVIQRQFLEKRNDLWYDIRDNEPADGKKALGIDFTEFFPKVEAQYAPIKSRDKRNEELLSELYRLSRARIRLGLDLKGGIAYTLKLGQKDDDGVQAEYSTPAEQMQDVITILRKRLDDFGVAEPVIRTRGDDMLEIQLPGLNSKDNAGDIEKLKAPAVLDFREVLPGGRTLYAPETPQDPGVQALPAGYTYLPQEVTNPDTGETSISWLPVEKRPDAAGDIIKQAFPIQNESGIGFKINMSFTPDGTKRFANITGEIAKKGGGQLAIVLDGVVRSAPGVDERISGGAEITGNFTRQEAVELANVLNNPLSVELELGEKYEVSPTLAKDSKEKSISAAKLGAILIIAFMVVYYFAGGIVAVCSVALNVLLVLGVLASLGATLTLPGVAALVLTVGMAVDANILIFERIREELNLGKSLENALNDGYNKAFSTIIDANLTTLITAGILFFLGTGPVRGFGLTLAVGIAASVFCALVVSRFLLETGVHGIGLKKVLGLKLIPDDRAWKFLERRKPLMIGSAVLIIAGVAFTGTNLQNILGIDFTGGDEITIEASSGQDLPTETEIHQIRDANENFKNAQVFYIQDLAGGKEQLKLQTDSEMGGAFFDALVQQHDDKGLQIIGESQIGGAVSKDIQKNAWLAVAFALVGILLYVAFRFELGYGIGAVAATIHDVLITIGLYVLLGKLGLCSGQFTAPMLAALLMILGYSINDTIVLFDRIREELKLRPDLSLGRIINFSVNRVLPRTILTSITTLLAATALYVYGAGIIRDFSFVFILGILTGTYSSIFIASPIFFWWHKGDRKHVEQREFLPKYDWNEDA